MKYIWINPVTESMYDAEELNTFLIRHGYKRVSVTGDWLNVVKGKYRTAVEQSEHTVIDMRCPKIREMAENSVASEMTLPDIHPILIHCAQELAAREDLRGVQKSIITPCQALADLGNALKLEDTEFFAWNQFLERLGDSLNGVAQRMSPIPPGFFEGTVEKVISVTGEEEIRTYFENFQPGQTQIAEMLFCKNGCHNGDGVRICEG